jgi:hypothetical protein
MAPLLTNSLDWPDSQKPMFSRPIHVRGEGVLDHRQMDVRRIHFRHGEGSLCTDPSSASLDSAEHIRRWLTEVTSSVGVSHDASHSTISVRAAIKQAQHRLDDRPPGPWLEPGGTLEAAAAQPLKESALAGF